VSSIGCKVGEVNVCDSLYSDLDELTKRKLMRVFGLSKITVHCPNVHEQVGVINCDFFAIAFAINLAFGRYVLEFQYLHIKSTLLLNVYGKHSLSTDETDCLV